MGLPQTPNPTPRPYSQALQLRLYQAFIYSIPVLFAIILILLLYLFYLKKMASSDSVPSILPRRPNQTNHLPCGFDFKGEIQDKLEVVQFDEHLKARDSQCCVCLGEFEMEERLHQVPSCKHVFHIDCILHWLQSHATCPLCRSSVAAAEEKTPGLPVAAAISMSQLPAEENAEDATHFSRLPQQQPQQQMRALMEVGSGSNAYSSRDDSEAGSGLEGSSESPELSEVRIRIEGDVLDHRDQHISCSMHRS